MKIGKNIIRAFLIMAVAYTVSVLFDSVLGISEHVTTVFVFAVFLVSLLTEGYVYGIVSAVVGVFAVHFAFAFPKFDFALSPEDIVSAVVMSIIAVLTGALTTKIKKQEMINLETEREKTKANLLRAISHDIRTPLTAIYGSAEALLADNNLNEESRLKMLSVIKDDSEWLIRMVENLLSVTRIDSGKIKIQKTPTVVGELVDSVVMKFKKKYSEINLNVEIPDSVAIVPMDAMLIQQVIINMLENAVIHAKGMNALLLKVTEIGNKVVFQIKDDGCGIDPEKLNNIFNGSIRPESHVYDGKKRNCGIGLSVCATIIKAHGGEMDAQNKKTGGAVFSFSLSKEESVFEQ